MSTTATSARRAPPGPAAVGLASVGLALAGLTVAGCSAASHAAAGSAGGRPATASAAPVQAIPTAASPGTAGSTVPVPATAAPTAGGPATGVAPAPSPAAGVPTLGRPAGDFSRGAGFGRVKPAEIFNGGDPTGLVTHVAWRSWGGSRAVATGTSDYVGPSQTVAEGTEEPATVVAFDLGTCGGKLMYRAVEWYFPQHHQAFDPHRYENICTGTYAPRRHLTTP